MPHCSAACCGTLSRTSAIAPRTRRWPGSLSRSCDQWVSPSSERRRRLRSSSDGVQDLADVHRPRSPTALGGRDQRADQRPLTVSQITLVPQPPPIRRPSMFRLPHEAPPPTQVPHKERMARPVGKGVFVWLEQSASTYPVSGAFPGQDGDPRSLILIITAASRAVPCFQVFKLPFDCQGRAHCQRPPPVPSHWSFRQKPQSARRGHAIRIAGRRSEPE